MKRYSVEAKSRIELRQLSLKIREKVGYRDCLYFPIVSFMEHVMPKYFSNYNYEIVPDRELLSNQDAVTIIQGAQGTVVIKESVYEGACSGNGRHRMTIAHEVVGHYVPVCVMGYKIVSLRDGEKVKAYNDPEWQAKCLSGEFMMPQHLVGGDSPEQLIQKCGVSQSAAIYQSQVFRKEGKCRYLN